MSVYDELMNFKIIPDAFDHWEEYRSVLTGYILSSAQPDTSIAIFGAGRCNDIDLSLFVQHFSAVTLFDADENAMREALKQYKLTDCPKIKATTMNFTGITPDDYRSFSDELSSLLNVYGNATDIRILSDYASFKLKRLYRKSAEHIPNFGKRRFDYSMAFGVHSQLYNMPAWIWSAFCANLNANDPAVEKQIIMENERLIPRFNDAVLRAAKKRAYFGCELLNSATGSAVEGAIECIRDLKNRGIVARQSVIDWPFDTKQGIVYQMLIQEVDLPSAT